MSTTATDTAAAHPASAPGCDLFTGERLVVFLFVSLVGLSVPDSLVGAAAALGLLAAAAFAVELAAEGPTSSTTSPLKRFKTRPGASSGILLGAVTLPSVMLSRLIQLTRISSKDGSGSEELAYLEMQYWAASASCFGMLVFFMLLLRRSHGNSSSKALMYGSLLVVPYMMTCYFTFVMKPEGWSVTSNLLLLLCHGVATVILNQHILHKFPSCASFGEALLVSSGLVLYFGDMLARTASKMDIFVSYVRVPDTGNEIATVIQGVLFGLFVFTVLYKILLQAWAHFKYLDKQRAQTAMEQRCGSTDNSVIFYVSLLVMLILAVPAWMNFVQDFRVHPLLWVLHFVFIDSLGRLAVCAYWMTVICASVVRFYNISKNSKTERILLRKYYHLVAVLMFSPAVILQPAFLDLAFGAALSVFVILEMIRIWKIRPLGQTINQFMNAFTDHRDSEILIVSHFSLLLGCALPKWMSAGHNDRPLAPFAGILSLGIGDTMASMIGYKYGVLRWSKTGKKTIEGTAAGITSVLAACSILLTILASSGYILSQHWLSLLIAVTLSGMLEAYTAQLDNAFIPLVFYSLLCL